MTLPARTNSGTLPAHIAGRQLAGRRRMVDQLSENLGVGSPPYLSIAGGQFTLMSSQGEQRIGNFDQNVGMYVDLIILDQNDHISKIFYEEAFTPGQNEYKPPDCFSHNGSGPSIQASHPQSQTCASCQWFAWGSAYSNFSGKAIKACSDYQLFAVVVPGYPGAWLLRVPPGSLSNLSAYKESFRAHPDTDIRDVITRMWFEPGKTGTLIFHAADYAPPELIQYCDALLARRETDAIVGRTDKARDPNAPLPPPQQYEQVPAQQGQQQWPQPNPNSNPNPNPSQQQNPQSWPAAGAAAPAPGGAPSGGASAASGAAPGFPTTAPGPAPSTPPQGAPQQGQARGRPRNRRVTTQPPQGAPNAAPTAPFRPQEAQQPPQNPGPAPAPQQSAGPAPGPAPGAGYVPGQGPAVAPPQGQPGAAYGMPGPAPMPGTVSAAIDSVIGPR